MRQEYLPCSYPAALEAGILACFTEKLQVSLWASSSPGAGLCSGMSRLSKLNEGVRSENTGGD